MENSQGWIKLHRQIMETPEWLAEPFTRGQAWVDLLLLANHKTRYIRKRGILVAVERGQVGYSEEALAERWRWSRGKVRRFLSELARLSRISHKVSEKTIPKNTSVSSLICIINYEKYQMNDTKNDTENDTEDGRKTVQEQRMKRIIINNISPKAEEVISYLNQKTGKQYKNTKFIQARLNEGRTVDDCKRVINAKIADPYFIQNPKYLNPETLFRPNHFDRYLNESVSTLPDLKEEKIKSTSISICPRCHAQIPPQDRFGEGCIRCETLEARA